MLGQVHGLAAVCCLGLLLSVVAESATVPGPVHGLEAAHCCKLLPAVLLLLQLELLQGYLLCSVILFVKC